MKTSVCEITSEWIRSRPNKGFVSENSDGTMYLSTRYRKRIIENASRNRNSNK